MYAPPITPSQLPPPPPPSPFLSPPINLPLQPKLSGLDTVHLTCLLSSWSTLKYEPEPHVMRSVMAEVYTKLPLFDDKVSLYAVGGIWCF
jgi:hypothetical protein